MKPWLIGAACTKILALVVIVSGLVCGGCVQQPQKNSENKITVWHWLTDRKDALEELAAKYESETGVKVEFKLFFPADIYSSKVIAAARAKNLPDIFGILGEKKTVASFIKAGHVLNLSSYMKDDNASWERKFYPKTLAVTIFTENNYLEVEPGIYSVPIDTTIMQFAYNRTLLTQAGLESEAPVKDFNDFITLAKQAKKATAADGFVCGFGESWLLNALATEWAMNIMGEDDFIKTIRGEIPYTDKKWLQVFSLFETLRGSGILPVNIGSMNNKEAEDAFSKGKAVFAFNGSWSVNVYSQKNPNLDYGFFSLPLVNSDNPLRIWGGGGSTFMVNAGSPQKEQAVRFLKWLTAKEQQTYLIARTNNLPSVQGCETALSPLLASLLDNLDKLTHPDTWPINENSRVLEIMNRGLQQVIMGIKTAKEIAQEIQQVKERIGK